MAKHQPVTLYAAAREIASSGASASDGPSAGAKACAAATRAATAMQPSPVASEPARFETVGEVLIGLVHHPIDRIARRWNWKSAVLSSATRAALFFTANLSAGLDAAFAAMLTELVFRGITAGFYGGLTQSFRHATPHWLASVTVMVLLPITTHASEFVVHWSRGTERLTDSLTASILFTIISTLFNLFAMRRGVLIVGEGRGTLLADLRQIPRLIVLFVASLACLSKRSI
jgi:hypothetical protein